MPAPQQFNPKMAIQQYDATGNLQPITRTVITNEYEFGAPVVELALSPSGLNTYGASTAVTAITPDRTLYPPTPAGPPAFEYPTRSFAALLHSDLPPNVRLKFLREDGWTANAIAAATAFSGIVTAYTALSPEGYQDAARCAALLGMPFGLFDDSTAQNTGPLHMQLHRTAVVSDYDPTLDQGNAGRAVVGIFTPISAGLISGRAPESAIETAGDGPAWILARPYRSYDSSPLDPLVGPGSTGVDDNVTPTWRQIGCLLSSKELEHVMEYSTTMKGYNDNVIDRTSSKNLYNVNASGSSRNVYLRTITQGGVQAAESPWAVSVTPTPFLQQFEVLVLATNSKGYVEVLHIPQANIVPNGNEVKGARGDGNVIPFQVMGNVYSRWLTSHSLIQMSHFAVNCTIA